MIKGIGQRIKETRVSRGWSQEDLAKEVGVTKFLICRYENETVLPQPKTLARIACALNTDMEYLMAGEDDASRLLDLYGDFFDENSRTKIAPVDIPPNSNYFCLRAKENYTFGIAVGDILILRPTERPTSDGIYLVEQIPNRLLLGSLRGDFEPLRLYQDIGKPPTDISDGKKYKIIAELMYSVKAFGRR